MMNQDRGQNSGKASMQSEGSDSRRAMGDRVGALEQDMQVLKWRISEVDRRHDSSPERLAKVELVVAHLSEKLDDIELGMSRIEGIVDKIGTKIAWGLGAAAMLLFVINKAWPLLFHVIA